MEGSIVYCDRVKHVVEESVEQIEEALRGPILGSTIESIGQVVYDMTDGPPGFMKVTPNGGTSHSLALSMRAISSYQPSWV